MRLLLSALLLLTAQPLLATDTDGGNNLLAWALQTGALLVFVLGLFLGLVLLMNRLRRFSVTGNRMQLLETLPISRSEKLCRVQIDNRIMILGVTPGGITTLGEQAVEAMKTGENEVTQDSPFARILNYCRSQGRSSGVAGQ